MRGAKIQLSKEEKALVKSGQWILTKNNIIAKIAALFQAMAAQMQQSDCQRHLGLGQQISQPKISKGERYQGLPYVVLDYPREFGKENILAVRTIFWWGNYFTTTLHLKGIFMESFTPRLMAKQASLAAGNFLLCIDGDEWSQEISTATYRPILAQGPFLFQEPDSNPAFIKVAAKTDFTHWDHMGEQLLGQWEILMGCLEA